MGEAEPSELCLSSGDLMRWRIGFNLLMFHFDLLNYKGPNYGISLSSLGMYRIILNCEEAEFP